MLQSSYPTPVHALVNLRPGQTPSDGFSAYVATCTCRTITSLITKSSTMHKRHGPRKNLHEKNEEVVRFVMWYVIQHWTCRQLAHRDLEVHAKLHCEPWFLRRMKGLVTTALGDEHVDLTSDYVQRHCAKISDRGRLSIRLFDAMPMTMQP